MISASGSVGVVNAHALVWDVNTLDWVAMQQPVLNAGSVTIDETTLAKNATLIDGTLVATIPTGGGRTLAFAPIAQGGAGTTSLVSANATKRIKLVGYVVVMSAAGTIKFTDDAGDLTGAMAIVANGGISSPGQSFTPLLQTGINKALSVVTTGGAANGHLAYFLE